MTSLQMTGVIESVWFNESFFSSGMVVMSTPQNSPIYIVMIVSAI